MSRIEYERDGTPVVTYSCRTCSDTGYQDGETRERKDRDGKVRLEYPTVTWCGSCDRGLWACSGYFASRIWSPWEKRPRRSGHVELERFCHANPTRGVLVENEVERVLKARSKRGSGGNPFKEE